MKELPKAYDPRTVEDRVYKSWEQRNLFAAKEDGKKKPYSIVIPPPNITGILHMGHALNNTIQDILIRFKRMQGHESLWMPGTDHAGIATQNAVEKDIAKENLRRQDLGREEFIERVWKWKEEYGSTIIHQLKKLGASCDWSRTRFTMDDAYSRVITDVFVRLHGKGLIYQGNYIINWCPRCHTALSDEEAPRKELQGSLYYFKYPFKDDAKKYVMVATTRPETMLGDTAVAVNPKDKRYKKYIGQTLILPLINREIKIIADDMVDKKFGTGAVKVTPAHDPNDYAMGKKHGLEFVNVMHPDGRMNENAGEYKDMDRFEARKVILKDLKEKNLLEKVEPHQLSAGHCYRCHTIIEPYLSKQWFVKMKPLAKPAIDAVKKGKIKFYPARWTKVYLNWMENIHDWCISRQIWWGHRIPVYYCTQCEEVIVSNARPDKCPKCNSEALEQDPDVLDTWFSSWLWPFATFYWPFSEGDEKNKTEFEYFYPTNVLVTAQEIIFFWVARMIMAGFEFTGEIPFKDVYIHGTVRDDTGTKMSKSLGNVIDPLEIIGSFGADALRFSIISITATGQDVFLSPRRFEIGRNFANKIWNATRYILTTFQNDINVDLCVYAKAASLKTVDKWILSRFFSALKDITESLDNYRFNDAASRIYEFFWHEFCDWYIEFTKLSAGEKSTQIILYKVLEKSLRVLHPFMPFITEELWQNLPHERDPIMISSWPHLQKQFISKELEDDIEGVIQVITAIRNIRSEWNIDQRTEIKVVLSYKQPKHGNILKDLEAYIKKLCRVKALEIGKGIAKPSHSAYAAPQMAEVYIPLEGIIDFEKEKSRLIKQKQEVVKRLEVIAQKLKNKNFMERAPKDIIEKTKLSETGFKSTLKRLEENLKDLS
ncbi:MAG: valine--tRNA ligase [Candidatus Omnitrophica bacterium]|nr:valine--tRNA ligase [Candidatus Omnitrophota bacterium]